MPSLLGFDLVRVVSLLLGLVVALTVHEASHAWMANRLGDPTARRLGRLTLNPLAHLDPLGTLMMVWTAIAGFGLGWAKPVPVNPHYLRVGPRTGMALVSLSGPCSNLLLATVLALAIRFLAMVIVATPSLRILANYLEWIDTVIVINVVIAIFNLIPIPPLDGFHVLVGVLPHSSAYTLARLEQYGPFILLALLFFGYGVLSQILRFFAFPIIDILTMVMGI